MNRKDVIKHVLTSKKPIPALRVINSFIDNAETNWPEFFKEINDKGLDRDSCIIGLNAKEREMKQEGRFFALMSWKMREYFVVTEYIIKKHYVPLFKGLTMADDLTTVTQKMRDMSAGQVLGIDLITITNSIDYTKWNNH